MPILIRYYFMAVWPVFFLAMAIWLLILNLLYFSLQFVDYVFVYQAGFTNCMRLLLYYQPSFLVLAIPMAYLVALLVVYGRLSADKETMALESSGVSPAILVWPMIGVSLLMSVFLVGLMDKILPWGNTSFLKLQARIISERTAIVVRERVFIKDFDGYILYVREKDDKRDVLKGVTVEFLDGNGHPYRIVAAQNGTLHKDPQNFHVILDLNDGTLQQEGKGDKDKAGEFLLMQFKSCDLDLTAHKLKAGPMEFNDARNISIHELAQKIQGEKMAKADTRGDELEYHKKFSLPFSALAFAFIGIPLGLIFRTGSIKGSVLALSLVVVYDLFILYGQAGGPKGVISPFVAMWLPNWVLIATGLVMIYWLNHRIDFWRSLFKRRNAEFPTLVPPK